MSAPPPSEATDHTTITPSLQSSPSKKMKTAEEQEEDHTSVTPPTSPEQKQTIHKEEATATLLTCISPANVETKETTATTPSLTNIDTIDNDTSWQTLPALTPLTHPSPTSSLRKQKSVRAYYKSQNNLITSFVNHMQDQQRSSSNMADLESAKNLQSQNDDLWIGRAISLSFIVNVFLFIVKVVAAISTGSLSVIASAVDSCLDLLAGTVIFFVSRAMRQKDPIRYPQGKTRLEPLGKQKHRNEQTIQRRRRNYKTNAVLNVAQLWQSYIVIPLGKLSIDTSKTDRRIFSTVLTHLPTYFFRSPFLS